MEKERRPVALTAAFSLLLSLFVSYRVFLDQYSNLLLIFWLLSITLLALSTSLRQFISRLRSIKLSRQTVLIALLLILPAAVRIANYHPRRIHQDDMITAYFSAHYDLKSQNFFAAIPPERSEWVSQFPTPYFFLQKLFFLSFGESVLTVKLSVIPYVLTVSVMLHALTKRLLGKSAAVISVIFYSFLAISLYLETLGLHFIASTAAFLVFFYFLILSLRSNIPGPPVLTGISAGFCYLFYSSSYIAFPFMLIAFTLSFLARRSENLLKNFTLAVFAFLITTGPFFVYVSRFNNYFVQRTNQVSLLSGEWSGVKNQIERGETTPLLALKENFYLSIKSLYQDGLGGHGGYTFGRKALLERSALVLFTTGLITSFWLVVKRRKTKILLVLLVITASFGSVVFSIPPPAYHRFSLAFPFIAFVLAVPLHLLNSISSIPRRLKLLVILVILALHTVSNQLYFQAATADELNDDRLKLVDILRHDYPGRNVYIASFPNFAFEKIYYFTPNKKAKKITSDFHEKFLRNFNRNEKYVYVVIFSDEFIDRFQAVDPQGQVLGVSREYTLFAN